MSNTTTTSHPKSQPAYFEEFNEESNTVLPGTRQSANIAAKRSKPDIDLKKQAVVVAERKQDDASDSGYSSQAGATLTSSRASSLQDSKTENFLPLTPTRRRASKRVSTDGAMPSSQSRRGSPEKHPLQRNLSHSQRKENLRSEAVNIESQGRSNIESRESAARMRVTGEPVDAPRRQPQPRRPGPPSPVSVRPRAMDEYEDPVVRPATVKPRPRLPSQSSQTRPLSYHAATASEGNIIPGQPLYTRRPESLYVNTTQAFTYQPPIQLPQPTYVPTLFGTSPQQRQPSYPFPQTTYPAPYPPPSGPWVEPMRNSTRRSSIYQPRPPTAESPASQLYNSYFPEPTSVRRMSITQGGQMLPPAAPMLRSGSYGMDDEPDEDWYLMPPPSIPGSVTRSVQSRPSLRHSSTTTTAHPILRHRPSDHSADIPYESFHRLSIEEQRPPSRKQSVDEPRPVSRPGMGRRPSTSSSSISIKYAGHNYGVSPLEGREPPFQPRPIRRSQTYYDTIPATEERKTKPDVEANAEAYIHSQTAGIRPLTTEEIKKVARRKSKTNNDAGSGSGSRGRSSREGSDAKKSRNSLEKNRHSAGDSEVQIRQDENAGLSLTITNARQGMQLGLKGGQGQTINIRPGRNDGGQVQVRIESAASQVSSREGRVRSSSERRYSSHVGGSYVKEMREIEGRGESRSRRRSRSRAIVVDQGHEQARDMRSERDARSDRDTRSEREGRKGKDKEVREGSTVKEGNTLERFLRREKAGESRSRKSSRSVANREGAAF